MTKRRPVATTGGCVEAGRTGWGGGRGALARLACVGVLTIVAHWTAGCDQKSSVRTTIPRNGAENVDAEADIVIQFRDAFAEADPHDPGTLASAVTVRGEDGEFYEGTVSLTTFAAAKNGAGVASAFDDLSAATSHDDPGTVPDIPSRDPTTGNPTPNPTTGNPTTGGEADEPSGPTGSTGMDTLVFSLDGDSFLPGERISVRVDGLRIKNLPIDSHTFSFTVKPPAFNPSNEDLRVVDSTPVSSAVGVSQRPRVAVGFSRPVQSSSIGSNVTVRGEHSGSRTLAPIVFSRMEGDGVAELALRLESETRFDAGEWVTVNLSDAITSLAATEGAATRRLLPHSFRFQAATGQPQSGWETGVLGDTDSRARTVRFGDVLSGFDGVEAVVLGGGNLVVYYRIDDDDWRFVTRDEFDDGFRPVDIAIADVNRDGKLEILTLLERIPGEYTSEARVGGKIIVSEVSLGAGFVDEEYEIELEPIVLQGFIVEDLNSDGLLDILVRHAERLIPLAVDDSTSGKKNREPPTRSTGFLTLLEQERSLGNLLGNLPGLGGRSPTDDDSSPFDVVTSFMPVGTAAGALAGEARRIELGDLDLDGKIDMLIETDRGLALYRNASGEVSGSRFTFQFSRRLLGLGLATPAMPANWGLVDIDADSDLDIITFDGSGAVVYRNTLDPGRPDDPQDTTPAPRGFFAHDVPGASARMATPDGTDVSQLGALSLPPYFGDVDGDVSVDVVLVQRGGGITVFKPVIADGRLFLEVSSAIQTRLGGDLVSSAPADANADGGLDIAIVSDEEVGDNFELLLAQDVEAPTVASPSTFSIDTASSIDETGRAAVVVRGSVGEPFRGYRLTLEFDETRLEFDRFEAPRALIQNGVTFESCPAPDSCGSFATVLATGSRDGGPFAPTREGETALLGTFHFKERPVTTPTTTEVFLSTVSAGEGEAEFGNTVSIVDGDATLDSPASIGGTGLSLNLSPPPGEILAINCEVSELREFDYTARVVWSSPGDNVIQRIDYYLNGQRREPNRSSARTAEFDIRESDPVEIRALAFGASGEPYFSLDDAPSCTVQGVFAPTRVECTPLVVDGSGGSEIVAFRIAWDFAAPVNAVRLTRNGELVRTFSNGETEYDDFDEVPGRNDYGVSGVLRREGRPDFVGPEVNCENELPDLSPDNTVARPTAVLLSLQSRTSADAPNVLTATWRNSEAYEQTVLTLVGPREDVRTQIVLDRLATRHVFEGAIGAGGLEPGRYRVEIVGRIDDKNSSPGVSRSVDISLPRINEANLFCESILGNQIRLIWDAPWRGYTSLELVARRNGEESSREPVALEATEITFEDVVPDGNYEFALEGVYNPCDGVPASECPDAITTETSCAIGLSPTIRVGRIDTGVGLGRVMIPISADLFGTLDGFTFTVDVPAVLELDPSWDTNPERVFEVNSTNPSVSIDALDVSPELTPESLEISSITVSVSGAKMPPSGGAVLGWIIGSIPQDFSLSGEAPIRFRPGTVAQRYEGQAESVVPSIDHGGGLLVVHRRFIATTSTAAEAGGDDILVSFFWTSDSPSIEGCPDAVARGESYGIQHFQLFFTWDPRLLQLQPITEADQTGHPAPSQVDFESLFFKQGREFENQRRLGNFLVGYLPIGQFLNAGSDGGVPAFPLLEPGFDERLLTLRFKPLSSGVVSRTITPIVVVTDADNTEGAQNFVATRLNSNCKDAQNPDLEAAFDGAVILSPSSTSPALIEITPTRGSVIGGGIADVFGVSLTAGVESPDDLELSLRLRRPSPLPAIVRPAEILESSSNHIRFTVPSTGQAYYRPNEFATAFDVVVTTPGGTSSLDGGYVYEYLDLQELSPRSGSAKGGELVRIRGRGIAENAVVAMSFRDGLGVLQSRELVVEQRDPEGRFVSVRTPDIEALNPLDGASFEVTLAVPPADITGSNPVTQIRDTISGFVFENGPRIAAIEPASGPMDGGTRVRITVENFSDLAGQPLSVTIDGVAASAVTVTGNAINATSPAGSRTGGVPLVVTSGVERAESLFTYAGAMTLGIEAVSPSSGSVCGGEVVTITGFGFTPTTSVDIGLRAATVLERTATTLRVVSPGSSTAGAVSVQIRDDAESAVWSGSFTMTSASFMRGDADGDGSRTVTDSKRISDFIAGHAMPAGSIPDAYDVDDDGDIDADDSTYLLNYVLGGGPAPPAPFASPGVDPTEDDLPDCMLGGQ